jgi:hypothetical protein
MNEVPFPPVVPFIAFGLTMGLVQLVWQVAVIVFLYKIWQKVKHLPAS